jgi:hypothetical protein
MNEQKDSGKWWNLFVQFTCIMDSSQDLDEIWRAKGDKKTRRKHISGG